MAEDTEALKHNFFFKGFFNRRGYYSLASLSPQEYRQSKVLRECWEPSHVAFRQTISFIRAHTALRS